MITTKHLSLLILSGVISSSVYAGQGGSPSGKPFISINDEIVEVQGAVSSLQDQIDLLVEDVNTLEGRAAANEGAIETLEIATQALQFLVDQNLTDISEVQSQISALETDNDALAEQIATNSGDIVFLQEEMEANTTLLNQLQSAVLAIENDLISLNDSLTTQIDNNAELIGLLQQQIDTIDEQLTFHENLANGTCPDGSAVVDILDDGSSVCGAVGGSGSLNLTATYRYTTVPSNGSVGAYSSCPSGMVAIGGGWFGPDIGGTAKGVIARDEPSFTAYNVIYRNYENYSGLIRVQALCSSGSVVME